MDAPLAPTRLLVADPDPWIRRIVKIHLEPQHAISYAATGIEALSTFRASHIDLAIVEYQLGDLSGLEVLTQLRAAPLSPPVIIVTGAGSERVCASAFRLGARDYLIKPFVSSDLLVAVRRVLGTPARAGASSSATSLERRSKEDRVRHVVAAIHAAFAGTLSLERLAGGVGVSPFTLSRWFKAIMKVSFRDYVAGYRISRARDLLVSRDISISEIAQAVGFSDLPRFDKVFKRRTGVTPSAYRARAAAARHATSRTQETTSGGPDRSM